MSGEATFAPGPLGRMPTVEAMVAPAYAMLDEPRGSDPVTKLWIIIKAALQVSRDADRTPEADLAQALAAALGELIADLPPERQTQTVQVAIHQAFGYAERLRAPGFDQPHGATGRA